jgi:hypothetical protein
MTQSVPNIENLVSRRKSPSSRGWLGGICTRMTWRCVISRLAGAVSSIWNCDLMSMLSASTHDVAVKYNVQPHGSTPEGNFASPHITRLLPPQGGAHNSRESCGFSVSRQCSRLGARHSFVISHMDLLVQRESGRGARPVVRRTIRFGSR